MAEAEIDQRVYKRCLLELAVDAAKAMGNFTGWTYAADNAIASEVGTPAPKVTRNSTAATPYQLQHITERLAAVTCAV